MQRPLLTLDDVRPLSKDSRLDTVKERLLHSSGGRYDRELLADCARSWNNKDDFRRERARVLRYLFGNQWGDYINFRGVRMTEEEYIKLKHNVPLKNNVMVSLWMSVFGLHAKQETEPVCYARSEDSKNLSDMMSAALQTNWQNTYMPDLLDVVFAEFLISGAAFTKESYEEREELHDSYTDYINPYYMFWEAGSDPAHRDVRMIGYLHDISPAELYFRFAKPKYGLTIRDLNGIFHIGHQGEAGINENYQEQNQQHSYENVSFYTASDAGLVRVIEVWREEVKPRWQCHDPLAVSQADAYFRVETKDLKHIRAKNVERKMLYDQQGVPEEKRAYITAEHIVDKYWHYCFMSPEGRILCEGETPYDYKSHPFSMTLFPYINGEIHPFMSFFIDQQRYINRLVMMNDMAVRSAVKGLKFLPLSLKPDDMTIEQYANQSTEYDAVFVYDDRKAKRTGAKPEFFSHSAFNIGTNEMLQTQLNMIHEVSGVSGALQGKTPTSGTSFARYQMETQNATTTIYPLIKRFNSFKERMALKKCITMQQFYEEGRDITPKSSDKQVFYRAQSARNVQFRTSIKESASTAAYQQLGNQFLELLFNAGAIPARMFIKNFDAPFTDKILVEYDNYMQQLQQGQMPNGPVQVPGANQQQAQMATQALMGQGQLFMRQQPQGPLTPYQQAA